MAVGARIVSGEEVMRLRNNRFAGVVDRKPIPGLSVAHPGRRVLAGSVGMSLSHNGLDIGAGSDVFGSGTPMRIRTKVAPSRDDGHRISYPKHHHGNGTADFLTRDMPYRPDPAGRVDADSDSGRRMTVCRACRTHLQQLPRLRSRVLRTSTRNDMRKTFSAPKLVEEASLARLTLFVVTSGASPQV